MEIARVSGRWVKGHQFLTSIRHRLHDDRLQVVRLAVLPAVVDVLQLLVDICGGTAARRSGPRFARPASAPHGPRRMPGPSSRFLALPPGGVVPDERDLVAGQAPARLTPGVQRAVFVP